MKKSWLLLTVAPMVLTSTFAATTAARAETKPADGTEAQSDAAAPGTKPQPAASGEAVFSTGVAKGRDRLDSATSTSALRAADYEEYGARSLGEILRNIPGIRVQYQNGEGNANYSIRGLPLASTGSKYMLLQEDGLPVLEFGDLQQLTPDLFMRADLNIAQIEAIRGGSASSFASNSPGGVINLLSKTGDVEGGAVQTTFGLNYGEHRVDADYGHKLSDTLRFHLGGFYRQGEGPRSVGFDAYRGGQVKFNMTKQFSNGFVRVYAKFLDDRTPYYHNVPIRVSGTNADPVFSNLANFDIKSDSLMSRNNFNILALDKTNRLSPQDVRDGQHAMTKSIGFDGQFDVSGWSISEKFRFSKNSGGVNAVFMGTPANAAVHALTFGGVGARLSYATGPLAGQAIANPSTLNGNGILVQGNYYNMNLKSLDNVINDLRASKVWKIGRGDFTTTIGFYKSSQSLQSDWAFLNILTDVRGDGNAALVNVSNAAGVPQTQDGYIGFGFGNGLFRRSYDVNYSVNAPYGSINYHLGKLAIGGSLRYDIGNVKGTLFGAELGGGRNALTSYDINGNGVISVAESKTSILPLTAPGLVDYNYRYLSYSGGVNFRVAEPFAVFARHSRGGRAAADRILFTRAVNYVTGDFVDPASAYDTVKQTELGMKLRMAGFTVNVTGFSATTGERNTQTIAVAGGGIQTVAIVRSYDAKGIELETGFRRGPFSVTAGATYTKAKIASDEGNASAVGKTPRQQANFIFSATPQVDTKYATLGANIIGTTASFAQDTNVLKQPGYTLVNAFVQVRPIARTQVLLNINNLFDTLAIGEISQGSIPPTGIVMGRTFNRRTLSGTLRYSF